MPAPIPGRTAPGRRRSRTGARGEKAGSAAALVRAFADSAHGPPREPPTPGRTGLVRFVLALVPSLAAAGILVALTAQGSIAASFAVSGRSFQISADRVEGTGFAQYVGVATAAEERRAVAVTVIDEAQLTDLCQSALVDTPVGDVTLLARAGRDGEPVHARNLVIDVRHLSGDVRFSDAQIGRDASTLDNPSGATGPAGAFSQQGGTVRITDLEQRAYSVNAGTFALNGLTLEVKPGDHQCF